MTDTAKRLAGPIVGTAAEATLYTVPAATVAILRNISVCNTTTTRQSFKMSVGADAAGTRFYSDVFVEPNSAFDWSGFRPLAATETLRWTAPATLTVTVSGVEVA